MPLSISLIADIALLLGPLLLPPKPQVVMGLVRLG